MNYPYLKNLPIREKLVKSFGGYEYGDNASVSTFTDMADMSADKYPLLSTRPKRARWNTLPQRGIFSGTGTFDPGEVIVSAASVNGRIVFCTPTHVFINGEAVPGLLLEDIRPAVHRIAAFGRDVFIYPDGIFIKTGGPSYEIHRACYDYVCSDVLAKLCNAVGTDLTYDAYGDELPEEPSEGLCFILSGDEKNYYFTYRDGKWDEGTEVYLKMSAGSLGRYAYAGEQITLKGIGLKKNRVRVLSCASGQVVYEISCRVPEDLLQRPEGLVYSAVNPVKELPALDFVCEHNNRLWGCRFGDDGKGNHVNELYACEQGCPENWDTFDGISTDSYRASLGCGGAFTGVCSLGGEVLFFKEEHIIRVSGNTPADFRVSPLSARGVEQGAEQTLVILNEKAFYKSPHGVTVYDGALPYDISAALGGKEYRALCAGTQDGKYYMKADEGDRTALLVYDTLTGLWHRESDNGDIRFLVRAGGRLFALCRPDSQSGHVYTVTALRPGDVAAFDVFRLTPYPGAEYTYTGEPLKNWYAVTGNVCAGYAGTRYVRSLSFRLSSDENADFSVSIRCNDSEAFREIYTVHNVRPGIFSVRVNTPRCDGFVLKLGGSGSCTVHSVDIITEQGSEVSRHG